MPVLPNKSSSRRKSRKSKIRHRHFLAAWVRSPLKIGALLPSSRKLARAMAAEVDLEIPGVIIELGAGTGVVTQALLSAGVPSDRLVIIERDRKLHAMLSAQFPELTITCADAVELGETLITLGVTKVSAIISSLPLLSMPKAVRQAIQHQMAAHIGHDGRLVQFTYGPRSPLSRHHLRQYHLHGKRIRMVVTNVPPAHVWVYRRI